MKDLKELEVPQVEPIQESPYDCDICKDERWIPIDGSEPKGTLIIEDYDFVESKTIYKKKCGCVIAREFERKLVRAGLEPIIEKIKNIPYVQKYDWQKENYKRAREFVDNDKKGFVISGQTGSGKTLLLGKMLYNFAHKGKEVFYFDWHNNYKGLLVDRYNVVNDDIMDKLLSVDVLYIDDLFKVMDNDYSLLTNQEVMIARKIIDRRGQMPNLKTMVSMELNSNDLEEIEPSLNGRFIEMVGNFDNWIQMNPKEDRNIRKQQAKGEF